MDILKIVFILLVFRCIGGNVVNLALYKPAVMSSLHYINYSAENAVDEHLGTNSDTDTCTSTDTGDSAPFWMVDLQRTFSILSVMITNKGGENWDRLLNFAIDIFTKNPLRSAAAVPVLCTNYTGATMASLESRNFTCSHPITGRFVRIKKWKTNNKRDHLELCDVQVFGKDKGGNVNMALNKPAVMSSIRYINYSAENAVDEDLGTNSDTDTCTSTDIGDSAPFWMVDLQGTFSILSVMITNRGVNNWDRLLNFAIEIFTKNPLRNAAAVPELCANYTGATLESSEIRNFTCAHVITGRFVRIQKWKTRYKRDRLELCDVQVFGEATDCHSWVAFYKTPGTRMRSQNTGIQNNCITGQCASDCHRNSGCVAFNYNLALQMCELVLDPRFEDELESNSDWSYYGPDL